VGGERNWAGNVAYLAARVHEPRTVAEVQRLVAAATRVRALGSRHSFSPIADTTGDLVAMHHLDRVLAIDPVARTVTVEGGTRYGELAPELHAAGWALHNLASLPHISVAGACATATHGSGDDHGNLATAVGAVRLCLADGSLVDVRRGDPEFGGVVVSLGALGIAIELTLDIEETFDVRQSVDLDLPIDAVRQRFDEVMGSADSVSLFTAWQSDVIEQRWRKDRVGRAPTSDGLGRLASVDLHPIAGIAPDPCTPQRGVPGPWFERLPHFRAGFTPSSGDELQSELFVRRDDGPDVIGVLSSLSGALAPVLKISEVRSIAADDLWLSPASRGATIAFHFTWVNSWALVEPVLRRVEDALEPFAPIPHWGKLTTIAPLSIRTRLPHADRFAELADRLDPLHRFRNPMLDALIG
jgi:xylitol oxidase